VLQKKQFNDPRTRAPLESLARRAAKRGVTQKDIARHAGVNQPTVAGVFWREKYRAISAATRSQYERAIDSAAAEKGALANSATSNAAEWLRGEIAAGRLSKKPSDDELRRVATIVRSAVLVAGANGASKKGDR
jgi:transcriptional regulator with XRE-family HTH domain